MKVVTVQQMRNIDECAIYDIGIPGIILMENAGLQTTLAMESHFGLLTGKKISIVCGKGNNGGDGMVIARHLHNRRAKVCVVLLADKEDIRNDARLNLELALAMNIDVVEVTSEDEIFRLKNCLGSAEIIVDAIFGTGLHSVPRYFYQQVIDEINLTQRPVAAVDIPSGLNGTTGEVLGCCVHAALTVTFGLPKVGLVFGGNRKYAGILKVVDIGIPLQVIDRSLIKLNLLEKSDLTSLIKKREKDTHKGDYGHVLVIAGSKGKSGAAILSATAALKIGAGLVTLAVP